MMIPKQTPLRDKKYLRWIAGLPCCICGGASQAAHVKFLQPNVRGIGQKVGDDCTLPLCPPHHLIQEDHQGNVTGRVWFRDQNVNAEYLTLALREIYKAFMGRDKPDAGLAQYHAEDVIRHAKRFLENDNADCN